LLGGASEGMIRENTSGIVPHHSLFRIAGDMSSRLVTYLADLLEPVN
jgi:hypothetical protein